VFFPCTYRQGPGINHASNAFSSARLSGPDILVVAARHDTAQAGTALVKKSLRLDSIFSNSFIISSFKENVKFFELKNYPERAKISLAYNPKLIDEMSKKIVDLVLNHDYRK